jgi:hypothetical protein
VSILTFSFQETGEAMSARPKTVPTLSVQERLELANQLYRQYHALCFWHSPRDLVITEELIYFVAKGLRNHGGRRGFVLAGKLDQSGATRQATEKESLCRPGGSQGIKVTVVGVSGTG